MFLFKTVHSSLMIINVLKVLKVDIGNKFYLKITSKEYKFLPLDKFFNIFFSLFSFLTTFYKKIIVVNR